MVVLLVPVLGFAWAGPIVGQGMVAGFHSALWIGVAIGIVALGMSLVLKPRPADTAPAASRAGALS